MRISYRICLSLFLSTLDASGMEPVQLREMPSLTLSLGEQRVLSISGLTRYSLGSNKVRVLPFPTPSIGQLHTPKESILIKGVEVGMSDLWVWKSNGSSEHRVLLIEKNPHVKQNVKLEKALEELQETEVIYAGSQVILRGKTQSLKECSIISSLIENFQKEVRDETTPSTSLIEIGQLNLEEWIRNSAYSNDLRLEKIGTQLWVRGSIEQPKLIPSLKKQLVSLFPLLEFDIESLPNSSTTIYFRVFLVELKKNHFSNLGLFWGTNTPQALQFTLEGIKDLLKIDLALQHLEGNGEAKILSNPELVVRAPGEAELFAGGEIPITTQNRYVSNVSWKKFGLTLKLKVTHVTGNRVRLDILTEVSHIDLKIGAEGIPGIQSNRMTTQVDAHFGTPLLLSGLLQSKIREEARGLPYLRNIPILGALFGSEDYLNERSELVAILYPQAPPPPPPLNQLKRAFPASQIPSLKDWANSETEETLKKSKKYPWNALE